MVYCLTEQCLTPNGLGHQMVDPFGVLSALVFEAPQLVDKQN